MDRLGHKLVALAVIFITIFVMTALPIKVAEIFYRQGKKGFAILSAIMCFGGGVFFGTYLLHMTPEVVHLIEDTITIPKKINYPVPYILIGAGFFMMMFMEKGVVEFQKYKERKRTEQKEEHKPTTDPSIVVVSMKTFNDVDNAAYVKSTEAFPPPMANGVSNPVEHSHEHNHVHPDQEELRKMDHFEQHDYGQEVGHSHAQGSAAKSIVLLLALSVDCVFEGLSLGLQKTSANVWKMVIAILSHEIVVAFSLGLQLFRHNSPKKTFLMAFIYGITCPVGIAIGTAIMEGGDGDANIDLVHGILLALTAGVFIYVTFFEILMHEISHDAKMVNLVAVLVGFGVMAALMVVHNSSHVHEKEINNDTCTTPNQDHGHAHYQYQVADWVDSFFVEY